MNNDFIICAIRELKRVRLRSIAVILGYAVTVILMLVTAAVLLFAKTAENKIMAVTGTHFVCYMPNCGDITSLTEVEIEQLAKGVIPKKCQELCKNCTGCNKKPFDILNEGFVINTNTTRLLSLDLVAKIKALASVKDASGYLMFRFRDPDSGRLFSIGGFDPSSTAVETTCFSMTDLVSGTAIGSAAKAEVENPDYTNPELTKFPSINDAASGSVMVDVAFAAAWQLQAGSTITIAGEQFRVSGIINTGVRPGKADVYMLFADAERVINRRIQNPLFQETNIILVEAIDSQRHEQAIKDVKTLVQSDAIVTYNCYKPAAAAIGLNEKSVWVFMLLVGCGTIVFAARTQLASILERRRQFAVLKAIGWKNQTIIGQVLAESMIQSISGCLLGVVFSMILLLMVPVGRLLGIDAEPDGLINPVMMGIIMLFAVGAGTLAGILPVIVVLRQRPAEALRRN